MATRWRGRVGRAHDRDIVVVWIPGRGRQPYYRSSGRNSGRPGQWFPFDGLVPWLGGWFAKHRFCPDPETSVPKDQDRYGLPVFEAVGRWLADQPIPDGAPLADDFQANHWINTAPVVRCPKAAVEEALCRPNGSR